MGPLRFDVAIPGGMVTAIVLAVAIAGLVVLGLRELRGDRRRERAVLLGALRVLTGLVALVVAVQPTWTGERYTEVEGRLAVLVDSSRSMEVAPAGHARKDGVRALLRRWAEGTRGDDVMVYEIGASVRPSSLETLAAEGLDARDDDTRIIAALRELFADATLADLGAVVVVSDGADTGHEGIGPALENAGIKVHTVAVGVDEQLMDDSIASVQADPIAFLRQEARVRVVVRSLGGEGTEVPVSLRLGEQMVREGVAVVDARGEAVVELAFTPSRIGRAVYQLSIPLAPGDAVPQNNERAFLVRVTRDKLRVLLVAGRPSWDERFLRSFLKRDPAIDLISFFILRTASDLTMAAPDELALIPFPTDELFSEHLGSFDLVLFQNFEFGPYQMASYLPQIRDYVERGGAFAMIGGDLSFGSGGYGETPLAEILPVTMPPATTPETRALSTARFSPVLAPDLVRHPLLELVPDPVANVEAWARLAPLQGVNMLTGLANGGRALLTHPRERTADGAPMPVLVVGAAQNGRTLALATDTTYRWGITTGGATGDASAYERFWDRALRWLTRDPALEPARVTTDRERYGLRARVSVTAELSDDRYEAIADRRVRLSLVDDSGAEVTGVEQTTNGEGEARATLEGPTEVGGYRAVARLLDAPEPLAEEGFVVESGGDELADPRARPELLRELSAATSGRAYDIANTPDLARLDTTRTRSLGITTFAPFATPWAFLGLLAAFTLEWVLRRAWGRR